MAKHPTSSRVHRGDDAPDDAFVSSIKRIVTWTRENQRGVTIGAAAILVLAGGAAWYITQQRSLERTAASRLTQVQQSVASGNAQLAIRDLQSFLDTFGSTSAGDQARLVLADLLVNQERPEEAIEALGSLPERLDDPFGLAAARLEAAALEALDRFEEAATAYATIAGNTRFAYQRREALADAARIELQHGDPAAAVDYYQRVLDTFDEQEAGRSYYRMWLAEARARAQTGQPAAQPADPPAAEQGAGESATAPAAEATGAATPDSAG